MPCVRQSKALRGTAACDGVWMYVYGSVCSLPDELWGNGWMFPLAMHDHGNRDLDMEYVYHY